MVAPTNIQIWMEILNGSNSSTLRVFLFILLRMLLTVLLMLVMQSCFF